jgi:transposase InsO family protein
MSMANHDHDHKKYPYLLRGVVASRPNHVWSTDITYLGLTQGFAQLTAIIDWYSRMILSWRLSNTMDVGFCIDCLDEALEIYGEPAIFNSDQGSQYTSPKFQDRFVGHSTRISMDGRGRWLTDTIIEAKRWLRWFGYYCRVAFWRRCLWWTEHWIVSCRFQVVNGVNTTKRL